MAAPSLTFRFICSRAHVREFSKSTCLFKVTPHTRKGKSSNQWITRQINDPYVKKSNTENFRCRSAYKLIEIDNRYSILKPGGVVIDCGAAPGSWSQVAAQRVLQKNTGRGPSGYIGNDNVNVTSGAIISVDLQHFHPIEGVTIFPESDFTQSDTQTRILDALGGAWATAVISDMAPNASGNKAMDHDRICDLCMAVLQFSSQVLAPGGHVVCKLWDGPDKEKVETVFDRMFRSVHTVKPASSRADSAEIFLLGMDYFLRKN